MSKFLILKQGSEEWLEARRARVTATDVAAIMGISPWKNDYGVYQDKRGESPPFVTNPAVEFGKQAEGPLREMYQSKVAEWFPPSVVESECGRFLASLDGINSSETKILEIKTCNSATFDDAQLGKIPNYYMSQAQMGLHCVPTAESVEFVFYNRSLDDCAYVSVPRDQGYIDSMIEQMADFYERYIAGDEEMESPESTHIQIIVENDDIIFDHIAVKEEVSRLKKLEKAQRAIIEDLGDSGDIELCSRVGEPLLRLTRVCKDGAVDWKALCKERGISESEISAFRKPQIGYYRYEIVR